MFTYIQQARILVKRVFVYIDSELDMVSTSIANTISNSNYENEYSCHANEDGHQALVIIPFYRLFFSGAL